MACSRLCSRNVCIRCFFVVFASDLMIPPSVFNGRDDFAKRHGSPLSRSKLGAYPQECSHPRLAFWKQYRHGRSGQIDDISCID